METNEKPLVKTGDENPVNRISGKTKKWTKELNGDFTADELRNIADELDIRDKRDTDCVSNPYMIGISEEAN